MAKMTKQGVPDLNTKPMRAHEHRLAPVTRLHPYTGRQLITMECYCGHSEENTEQEERERRREHAEDRFDEARW